MIGTSIVRGAGANDRLGAFVIVWFYVLPRLGLG